MCVDWIYNLSIDHKCSLVALVLGIAVFSTYVIYKLYLWGNPAVIKLIAPMINWFSHRWPTKAYIHSTLATAIASVVSFFGFIPFTKELIVNVTAVYATILFLNGPLNRPTPLLDIEFKDTPKSKAHRTSLVDDDSDDTVFKQKIKVENKGDAAAENIQLSYRVIYVDSGEAGSWRDDGGPDTTHLTKDGDFNQDLYLDTLEENDSEHEYIIEVKIQPSVREGHLRVRRFHTAHFSE